MLGKNDCIVLNFKLGYKGTILNEKQKAKSKKYLGRANDR